MPTEATASAAPAPATIATTATPAPTEGATTTTQAPAQGASTATALPGLAEAVADYQGHRARVLRGPAATEKPVAAVTSKEATTAPAVAADAGKTEPEKPAEAAAPPAAKPDDVSEGMVKILRQTRAVASERRRTEEAKAAVEADRAALAAERTLHAQQLEAARRFEETRKKDPVAATMELLGKETLGGTFPLDLINRLAEQEPGTPPTPEKIAEIAAAQAETKVRAALADEAKVKEAAEAKAKEDATKARAADIETKKSAFFKGLAHQLNAETDKYHYLKAKPVDWAEVDTFVVERFSSTGRAPTPEEIFKHFDGEREKDAAALASIYLKRNPPAAPSKPVPKTTTGRTATEAPRDTKGRIEQPPAGESQRERLDRVARELNQRFGH